MKLILDCNNLCYMSFYTVGDLGIEGQKTGVMFGFLMKILKLAESNKTNELIFCWDSRKHFRRSLQSDYKKRDKTKIVGIEGAFEQFSLLRTQVLPDMGFRNVFRQVGFESDDLMAKIVYDYPKEDCVIVSTDQDMYQLLEFCDIYNPRTKKLVREADFVKQWGIGSSRWAEVKGLAGCKGDNVNGVQGVAEKTAIKFLKHELKEGSAAYKRITSEEGRKQTELSLKLVTLPYAERKMKQLKLKKDRLTRDKFIDVFDKYQFITFLEEKFLAKWQKAFDL